LTVDIFPYTGSAIISGSLEVSGSVSGRLNKDAVSIDNTSNVAGNVSGSNIYPGMITFIDLSQSGVNTIRLNLSPAAEYPIGTRFEFYITDAAASEISFFRLETSETFEGSLLAVSNAQTTTGNFRLTTTGSRGDRVSVTNLGATWAMEGVVQDGSDYIFV